MGDERLIAEGRALLDAATAAPWPIDYVHKAVRHVARNCDYIESAENPDFSWTRGGPDAEFIVWARNNMDALLSLLERAYNETRGESR